MRYRICTPLELHPSQARWQRRGREPLENLLAVQKRVAEALLHSIRVKLDRREVAVRGPANLEQVGVYELYLQGRYHSGKRNVEALRKSSRRPWRATLVLPRRTPD